MKPFDVAIIGGGLAGCAAALHLRQRNASVVLIERRTCGSQASGVNYGGVRQQGRNLSELPLSQRSRSIWARLEELVGSDCEFTSTGHLKLARSDADMKQLESYAEDARELGLELELIGRQGIRERYPWLSGAIFGGSYCPGDGYANPRLVAPRFARAAVARGAQIHEGKEVVTVHRDKSLFHLRLSDGSVLQSHKLINVAGAWGSVISSQFEEPVPEDVMAPNMCVTDPVPYFVTPNLGVCGGGIYLRQIPRGNVIFGAGLGVADRAEIKAYPLAQATIQAVRMAVDLVPKLANAQIIRSWSGVEGVMPDGLPVLSLSQTTSGLVHAFGFSGHGFQLGPAVGEVVSELALDGDTATPIDAFRIDRFQTARACLQ